jgi:hypothetical protein
VGASARLYVVSRFVLNPYLQLWVVFDVTT